MNLVFVGSSPRAWGSEQQFVGLAKACHETGHRVVAVVRKDSEVSKLLEEAGVQVCATPFRGGADPRAMIAVFKVVRAIRADWIVACHRKHYWPLYVLARITGTKLAVFRHLVFVRDWMTRVVFPRLVDRFFVVSNFALETLADAGAPREHLTRLYNQIDRRQFRPDPERRLQTRVELGLPLDALVVGFIGRHEESKGVRILRAALDRAMEVNPDIFALWVGTGRQWLETREAVEASSHGWRHRFVEWSRMPECIYAALDCLVAPSTAVETFGRSVMEAQACGIPVVASTAGGLAEVFVPGRTGEEFVGYDPAVLAEQILQICADANRRTTMGRAGRRYTRRFDSRVIARAFVQELSARPEARIPGFGFGRKRTKNPGAESASLPELSTEISRHAGVANHRASNRRFETQGDRT